MGKEQPRDADAMTITVVVIAIVIVGLIVWQAAQHSQGTSKHARLELDRLRKQIQEVGEKQQRLINDSAQRGTKISTDVVLKHVEDDNASEDKRNRNGHHEHHHVHVHPIYA